eukprot:CAMPEP_0173425448 /NCGR_PEP_ID=MMETSP1357-20121228/5165_1 /TAXON_ID=77926 /ORGANISM="Hemiselmis rufescens, Strain PCC563" /LENGTH=98 /DNA_ID=CAMNT_0014388897 /DNA_START=14 /DNA_END=306 /DNA_ORIENTATION=+
MWRTSCMDPDHLNPIEPSHRFFSQDSFTRYSALGARSAWACLDQLTSEEAARAASLCSSSDDRCPHDPSPPSISLTHQALNASVSPLQFSAAAAGPVP